METRILGISEKDIQIDGLGREYDYSHKNFKVLCRSGWVEPSYIYRHKTTKDIYRVSDGNMTVDVTEDHSLFDYDKNKITPKEIKSKTKLEYYSGNIYSEFNTLTKEDRIDDTWLWLLNATIDIKRQFIDSIQVDKYKGNKIDFAKILYIQECINKN